MTQTADGEQRPTRSVGAPGRRHQLTVLFSDLCGSTALGRDAELEPYAELMTELRGIWHRIARFHGGLVIRTQGDGALIVFGYPLAREDDGRRAAEAALSIHDEVAHLRGTATADPPLSMRAGIHAGIIFLSEGDLERGRLDLNGDVANTAAHLLDGTAPGTILATMAALGPYANLFELGPDLRALPSNASAHKVVQILRRGAATRRFDATAQRGLTPLIGRQDAIDTLLRFALQEGPFAPRCFVVQAGAGVGKTRLLEELAERPMPDVGLLMRGHCENLAAAEVLQPFLQMLRKQGLAVTDGELPEHLIALCSGRRTLLLIDDWQWADDASLQLLATLLQRPDGPRVILAGRPGEGTAAWIAEAPHLTLRPFSASETELAVRRWLPAADPFLAARIHDYAGGVPLYVEELCHAASTGGAGQPLDDQVPKQTWLNTLVASRLARLPGPLASFVRAAAVIGNHVPRALLASVCDPPPTVEDLQGLAEADFLYPYGHGDAVRFKHGITRDAVYQSIGLYERTALHERIEAALLARADDVASTDREDSLDALAYHSRACGHWERAARFAEQAGDRAFKAFALDRARGRYLTALETLDRLPGRTRDVIVQRCSLVSKLGMSGIFDPLALGDQLQIFERAAHQAGELGDVNLLARALYWLGYMSYGQGRFRAGVQHARRALDLAQASGDLPLLAQVQATLGQILAAVCEYDEALALMGTAIDTKRERGRPGGGFAIGPAYTLACKGSVLADRGDFGPAWVCFAQALNLLGDSTHPVANSVRNWVAVALIWEGRWQEAERIAAESARIAENTRALLLLAVSRAVHGFARWRGGQQVDGLAQMRDAVQWITTHRSQFYLSLFNGWLCEAAVAVGDRAQARHAAAIVLRRARQGERLGEAVACRSMARLAAREGDAHGAERWLQRAEASSRLRGSAREGALNATLRETLANGLTGG